MGVNSIMPNGLFVPIITISLIFVPQSIFEFKNSSLLKRIGATPIKPFKFLLVIIIFNFIIIVLSVIILFILCFGIFYIASLESSEFGYSSTEIHPFPNHPEKFYTLPGWAEIIRNVDYPSFIYSSVLLTFVCMSIGVLISSFARSTLFIQGFGITIVLISFFIAPVVLPMWMVGSIQSIKIIGYFLPIRYPIALCVESFHGGIYAQNGFPELMNINNAGLSISSIWDINQDYKIFNTFAPLFPDQVSKNIITIFRREDKIANHVMPYCFTLLFLFITSQKFSWSSRSSRKISWRVDLVFKSYYKNFKEYQNELKFSKKNKSSPKKEDNENILEINDISKTFSNKHEEVIACENINFKIKRNENMAIIGGNGAGKTTLVEMVIGLNKPDSGDFNYNFKYEKNFQEGIGIQFQESNYPFGLKCKDIIKFVIDSYKLEISNKELESLISEFGIKSFYNKNASSLSGGQQQRLNLLLAIIHKPKIVFLDELSNGLDIKIKNSIKTFIKQFAIDNNITIVIVSHDVNEIQYLCKKIVILQKGKLVVEKLIDNVLEENDNLEDYISKYI
ncbi:MAG: ATP-binding cassette domain-containing protein [Metamycoplasmataceae bacterium]